MVEDFRNVLLNPILKLKSLHWREIKNERH